MEEENDLESRKRELKEKLENELYVDRYSTFKECVDLINGALDTFKINYNYTYNEFCAEFTEECLNYMDTHPNADMNDTRQMMIYIFPMIMSMLEKSKNKYGLK